MPDIKSQILAVVRNSSGCEVREVVNELDTKDVEEVCQVFEAILELIADREILPDRTRFFEGLPF